MNEGVLYVATGEKYIQEVYDSIRSLRSHNPDMPVTIISDRPVTSENVESIILDEPNYNYSDSIIKWEHIPYDKTLLLDTDTHICGEICDVFKPLDEFDMGVTINPNRYYSSDVPTYRPNDVPSSFPLFNGGVQVFQKNSSVREFFESWENIYKNTLHENKREYNQPALREALYKSRVRFFPLIPEYNCWLTLPGYIHGKVRILHGTHPNHEAVAQKLNRTEVPRCHDRSQWPIGVYTGGASFRYRLRWSLSHRGVIGTAKKAFSKYIQP